MSNDITIDGINLSMMLRNQKLLIQKVQRLERKEKELQNSISFLKNELNKKKDDEYKMASEYIKDIMR